MELSQGRRGREIRGSRYAIVVQHDDFEMLSTRLCVLTSTQARQGPFHVPISLLGERTLALSTQAITLDVETRLIPDRLVGSIDGSALATIRQALGVLAGGRL